MTKGGPFLLATPWSYRAGKRHPGSRFPPVTARRTSLPTPPPGPLLGVRSALVFLLAVLAGVAAALLAYPASHSLPAVTLVGGGAAGGAPRPFRPNDRTNPNTPGRPMMPCHGGLAARSDPLCRGLRGRSRLPATEEPGAASKGCQRLQPAHDVVPLRVAGGLVS